MVDSLTGSFLFQVVQQDMFDVPPSMVSLGLAVYRLESGVMDLVRIAVMAATKQLDVVSVCRMLTERFKTWAEASNRLNRIC